MDMQIRTIDSQFKMREEGEDMYIEGYFAVFNSNYEIAPDATESIAEGAFSETLSGDVRGLVNHDSTLVLGRNKAGTLELKEDSRGLWGSIKINPNDSDAMNARARVLRGDVDQCSFGFDIIEQDTEIREDGSVHWTIRKVKLYEVSICTFPAYTETGVSARSCEAEKLKEEFQQKRNDAWREKMLTRVKGEN